ncbi:MAG: hypothetical protein ACE5R4_03855 [Armatimonadota bacterium]
MGWAIAFFAAGFVFLAALGVFACVLSSRTTARIEDQPQQAPAAQEQQPEPASAPGLAAKQPTR